MSALIDETEYLILFTTKEKPSRTGFANDPSELVLFAVFKTQTFFPFNFLQIRLLAPEVVLFPIIKHFSPTVAAWADGAMRVAARRDSVNMEREKPRFMRKS